MGVIQRSKNTVFGLTTDLNNIKNAGGFDANLNYMSLPAANYISGAVSVRNATEILDSKVKELSDAAGDSAGLNTSAETVVAAINEHDAELGDVSGITTSASDVAGAINELDLEMGNIATVSIADGSATDVAGMINDLEAAKLDKSKNLSDVADAAISRNNLDVDSTSEVDAKILQANLSMGSNFSVADITARDAMVDLDIADRVFVEDDGDAKWALYKVAVVDGNGSGTAWVKIMDQDILQNAISAESIKASYETNADTNAFQDAEKTKVGFITITGTRDLDQVVQIDEFINSITLAGATNTKLASALAVKTYVDNEAAKLLEITNNLSDLADLETSRVNLNVFSREEVTTAIGVGGAIFKTEALVVTADQITLAMAPKNGVIFNFSCVRHVDGNGVAYDIPTTPTGDPKVFNIHPDAAGDFDTKSVTVQYSHTS